MADGHCYVAFPGFNDLRHTVIPIFLLLDHFSTNFLPLAKKMKKIYRLEV